VSHAAILGGSPVDLGTLGGTYSVPSSVNDSGWISGYSANAAGQDRAFVWRPADGMVDLGTIAGDVASLALGMDDHGHVIGLSRSAQFGGVETVVIWFPGGGSANAAPQIQPIGSQAATVDQPFQLTPVVTDAEDDAYTLTWTGDIPSSAIINGIFAWTPTAADIGDYQITVTATLPQARGLSVSWRS
jgi:probable HAF family extracellular repeat protein